jgi:hypothetical protein
VARRASGGWDKDGNLIIGGNEIKKIGKDGAEDSGTRLQSQDCNLEDKILR